MEIQNVATPTVELSDVHNLDVRVLEASYPQDGRGGLRPDKWFVLLRLIGHSRRQWRVSWVRNGRLRCAAQK